MIEKAEKIVGLIITRNDAHKRTPCAARIIFTVRLIDDIIKLSESVIKHDAVCIRKWNSIPDFLEEHEKGEHELRGKFFSQYDNTTGIKITAPSLYVYTHLFCWKASFENLSTTEFETDAIKITEIKELRHIMTMPKDELPTQIGIDFEWEITKNLFEERLREE